MEYEDEKAWCIALAAAMTFMSVMPAFAADTKIDTVKLTFSYDTAPASGDSIGSIHVSGDTSSYYVESAEYTNADDQDTWTVGDIPEVKWNFTQRTVIASRIPVKPF